MRYLVDAALAAGIAQALIYPSFDFLYPSSGSAWLDAQTASIDPGPGWFRPWMPKPPWRASPRPTPASHAEASHSEWAGSSTIAANKPFIQLR
jgi:hypothetical protein